MLRTTYLPAFHRAIVDAGAWSVMGSYNSYDGIPVVADHHIQEEILRDEWGYDYYISVYLLALKIGIWDTPC